MSEEKLSREFQEAPEEAPSHDLSALPSDYDLPRSPESHRGCVDGAAGDLISDLRSEVFSRDVLRILSKSELFSREVLGILTHRGLEAS